jgi:adenylate cyclase
MARRLAAILAADVAGYCRLMSADEAGTLAALQAHRSEVISPSIARHHGRIVKLIGDGILAEFESVVEAVECAVEVQRTMAERNRGKPDENRMLFRIGVHLGDIIVDGDDIYGDGVNIAARLEGLAEAGGIDISRQALRPSGPQVAFQFPNTWTAEAEKHSEAG